MSDEGCTRRNVLQSTAVAFTCLSCTGIAAGTNDTPHGAHEDGDDQCNECGPDETGLPDDIKWEVLDIEDEPMSIRYVDGYRDDAEWISEMAVKARDHVLESWDHELLDDITFDLYPDEYYAESHDGMAYDGRERAARMVAPADYNGARDPDDDALMDTYYLHGVVHEYVHAPQVDLTHHWGNGLDYPMWFWEGFAEGITVYHSDDRIRQQYHNRGDAVEKQQAVRNGYGYMTHINQDIYRGSMQIFRYLFDEYGIDDVAEIHSQPASNYIQAIELQIGLTPPQMEAEWLEYASSEFGGDYAHAYEDIDVDLNSAESDQDESDTSGESSDPDESESSTTSSNGDQSVGVAAAGAATGGVVTGAAIGGATGYSYANNPVSASEDKPNQSNTANEDSQDTETDTQSEKDTRD